MTEVWDATAQKERAFLRGCSVELTFGEELLMEHALSHNSPREEVPVELDGLHRYFSPTPRMQRDRNMLKGKAGENPFFIAPSSLEGSAEAQHVCDVQFLLAHQSQRDMDVV